MTSEECEAACGGRRIPCTSTTLQTFGARGDLPNSSPCEEDSPIGDMPGCFRLGWRHGLIDKISGQCSMIKASAVLKMVDDEKLLVESLMCIKRAGADIILTYFGDQAVNFCVE